MSPAAAQNDRRVVLRAAQILPGNMDPPLLDGFITVVGGRIEALGTGRHPTRSGEHVVDFGDSTILPGLIDCHQHLLGSGRQATGLHAGEAPPELFAAIASQEAVRLVTQGITTVRVLGVAHRVDILLRDAIQRGDTSGPRIVGAGLKLTAKGGHGSKEGSSVRGPRAARAAALRELAHGADLVKVVASGGVGSTSRHDTVARREMTVAEMSAVVKAAHAAGRRVTAHANGSSIDDALDAGVDSIEHGIFLSSAQAKRMAKGGVALVPTLSAMKQIATQGQALNLPGAWIRNASAILEAHRDSFRRAVEAGVRVAAGSDGFGDIVEEVALFVAYGLTPSAAICAATEGGAMTIRSRPSFGTLRRRAIADIAVVGGDPLQSAYALRDIRYVMASGAVIVDKTSSGPSS